LRRRKSESGREIAVETSVTALRDTRGVSAGYVGVFRDITERKRDEEKWRQLAAELSEADRR